MITLVQASRICPGQCELLTVSVHSTPVSQIVTARLTVTTLSSVRHAPFVSHRKLLHTCVCTGVKHVNLINLIVNVHSYDALVLLA